MRRLGALFTTLALVGCEALLGVDDVVLDGSGGGGGGGGASASATLGVGAGFAVSAVASGTGTDASASSGGGAGGCQPDLPPCAGATPSSFEGPPDLAPWTIDNRKVEVKGKKLEVDPDEDVASMRSTATLDASAACAVWITLEGPDDDEASAGIAVGSGLPGTEWIGIYRNVGTVVAVSRGQALGTTSVGDGLEGRNVLRLRLDGAGAIAADVKREGGCFEQVATATIPNEGPPSVTVFQVGDNGKSKFDDYCR